MNALMHKFGLQLELSTPDGSLERHKEGLASKIRRNCGVIFAEFSKQHPDIVVIEYDPFLTSPDEILHAVRCLNGDVKRKVFL